MYDVYVYQSALSAAERHFESAAKSGLEALGLLVGRAFSFNGHTYAVAEEYVTAPNDATSVSVRFSREAFSRLSASLRNGKMVVGWAHSHPGYGCFLSATDVRTQDVYFGESYHAALVVDPLRRQRKFFKLQGQGYYEVPYAVVRKK